MPWFLAGLGGGAVLLILAFIGWSVADSPARLQSQAEAAARAGDWAIALQHWRAINATKAARVHLTSEKHELAWHLAGPLRPNTACTRQSMPIHLIYSPGGSCFKSFGLRIARVRRSK